MKRLFALCALLSLPFAAYASTTTYDVNIATSDYTASGTITTDGHLGVLGNADILGYDFTMSAGGPSESFNTTDGYYAVLGGDLTATSAGLFYDFSDSFSYAGFSNSTSTDAICFGDVGGCFIANSFSGVSVEVDDTVYQEPALTGDVEIATTATPEPSSLLLFGSAALGLALLLWRRRFTANASAYCNLK
ncbi:MAG: PEP-CTERM sorting domain-containing protein [Terracidiphilus sp.]|jgi:hypothetical protein